MKKLPLFFFAKQIVLEEQWVVLREATVQRSLNNFNLHNFTTSVKNVKHVIYNPPIRKLKQLSLILQVHDIHRKKNTNYLILLKKATKLGG